MELDVVRQLHFPKSTIGRLFVDGVEECDTLEDIVRPAGVKIPKETAIPAGRYKVVIDFSERFQRPMMHLLDVPMFTGIRIHAGNTDRDTEGCLLTGKADRIRGTIEGGTSVRALDRLYNKVQKALDRKEEVWITIHNQKV